MSRSDIRGSVPERKDMSSVLPLSLWDCAIKQAERSRHSRHRTGCVIYNPRDSYRAISKGCSHVSGLNIVETNTIHAERHALLSLSKNEIPTHAGCLIVTLTRVKNFAYSSKPCASCAKALMEAGIDHCTFAEKANDGSWSILQIPIENLQNLKLPFLPEH